MQFIGMIINDHHKIAMGNVMELDAKNTTVAEVFKLLTLQLDTDFDLRQQGDNTNSKMDKVAQKLTPKE